jgi:cyclic pyranopterin phosphate synthase
MRPATLARIRAGTVAKGDALAVADVAAVMGAKRASETIPMCHALPLSGVEAAFDEIAEPDDEGRAGLRATVSVACAGPTGVEMEALCAVTAALLTLYDMCKAIDRGMRIENVQLEEKRGGRSGTWRRGDGA